jgi:hypothetical protein
MGCNMIEVEEENGRVMRMEEESEKLSRGG